MPGITAAAIRFDAHQSRTCPWRRIDFSQGKCSSSAEETKNCNSPRSFRRRSFVFSPQEHSRLCSRELRILDDLVPDSKTNQIAEAREIHFLHDVTAVAFDCSGRDSQRHTYFFVGLSSRQQPHHFDFARR
jgi:hypothetical protein